MIRLLVVVALLFVNTAWGRTMQCAPIEGQLMQLSFSTSGASKEIKVVVPKTHGGATLLGLSVIYGAPPKLVVPVDLWPGDNGTVEAHFEVKKGHEQLALSATYTEGACYRENTTTVQPWAQQ